MGWLFLAQSLPSIDGVEDSFVKSWVIMLGFATMLGLQLWQGLRGDRIQQRTISGSIINKPEIQHAEKSEVEELKKTVDQFRQESQAQYHAQSVAAQQRVQALAEVMDTETTLLGQKLDSRFDKIMERMDSQHALLATQIGSASELVHRHDAALPQIDARVTQLAHEHNETTRRLHARIDDTLRAKRQ